MSDYPLHTDDDLDIIELLLILWKGKWVILVFILLGTIISSLFFYNKVSSSKKEVKLYETKIIYSIEALPKINLFNYSGTQLNNNFKKLFFDKDIFLDWKKNNEDSSLNYDFLDMNVIYNDLLFSKGIEERSINFESDHVNNFVLIKFSDEDIIGGILNYTSFIVDKFTLGYVESLKEKKKKLSSKLNEYNLNFNSPNYQLFNQIMTIDELILTFKDNKKIINLQNPSLPKILNPTKKFSLFLIFILSIFSGLIGSFYILIRYAISKYSFKSAKNL